MWRYLVLAVLIGGAGLYYTQGNFSLEQAWGRLRAQAGATAPVAAPIYRWQDAQGNVHYGSEVPAGIKAEVASHGSVNTLSMPAPIKLEAPKKETAEPEKTIQQMATERAIEQATQ